eukprot:789212-Prymnesium_polylepis.2
MLVRVRMFVCGRLPAVLRGARHSVECIHLLVAQLEGVKGLEVRTHVSRRRRCRHQRHAALEAPAQRDLVNGDIVGECRRLRRRRVQRLRVWVAGARPTQGRVCLQRDPRPMAVGEQGIVVVPQVPLDLIDRDVGGATGRQGADGAAKGIELPSIKIGHADCAHSPRRLELLEGSPRVRQPGRHRAVAAARPVGAVPVPRARPVDEDEIDRCTTEPRHCLFDHGQRCVVADRAGNLGREKELVARRHAAPYCGCHGVAHLCLCPVSLGGVDVPPADTQPCADRRTDAAA